VNTEEQTYKVTVHLINGKKFRVAVPVTGTELTRIYKVLGDGTGRMKFPTSRNVMQYLPASSVLRIEAKGTFE
jgi:hypothetical protein